MKTFVCTCGTSIATKRKITLDRFSDVPLSKWDDMENDINAVKDQVIEELRHINILQELNETSAEIKSLIKMHVQEDDSVIFIVSDTIEGKLCAEIVADLLVKHHFCKNGSVHIKEIAGLQATDGKRFRQEGLKNLLNYLVSLEHQNIIFNLTGGYKSVVPYIALMGMIFNKPVKYIHEDSSDVITLTNVPLVLDDALISRVEDKLYKIEKETAITIQEWQRGLDYHDHRFDCFIEKENGWVTLSGLGLLFWERFKRDFPQEIERDTRPASEKENKLLGKGTVHHGFSQLIPISTRLLESQFVRSILRTCNNQPQSKIWVRPLSVPEAKEHLQRESECICIVTDITSDAGYSFLIETTAKNADQNATIAKILNRKYFSR